MPDAFMALHMTGAWFHMVLASWACVIAAHTAAQVNADFAADAVCRMAAPHCWLLKILAPRAESPGIAGSSAVGALQDKAIIMALKRKIFLLCIYWNSFEWLRGSEGVEQGASHVLTTMVGCL